MQKKKSLKSYGWKKGAYVIYELSPRPKEEPGTIVQWRVEQAKRLEEKDAKEAETMAKLRDEAQQELKDW